MIKRVVNSTKELNIINVSEVKTERYYLINVEWNTWGIIVRENYNTGSFKVICLEREFCNCNCWDYLRDFSLIDTISNAIKDEKEVYQFDTFKELAQFYIEQKNEGK